MFLSLLQRTYALLFYQSLSRSAGYGRGSRRTSGAVAVQANTLQLKIIKNYCITAVAHRRATDSRELLFFVARLIALNKHRLSGSFTQIDAIEGEE